MPNVEESTPGLSQQSSVTDVSLPESTATTLGRDVCGSVLVPSQAVSLASEARERVETGPGHLVPAGDSIQAYYGAKIHGHDDSDLVGDEEAPTERSPLIQNRHEQAEGEGPTTPAAQRDIQFLIDTDPVRFRLIFAVILASLFTGSFDGTIMASSHPVITSHFHAANSASWLSTSYLLTSTATQPLLGRLSDAMGRKPLFLLCSFIFVLSTLWCALAGTIESFIAARAVCGIGSGGAMTIGSILPSDLVPIE